MQLYLKGKDQESGGWPSMGLLFSKDVGKGQILRAPNWRQRSSQNMGKASFPSSSLLEMVIPFTYLLWWIIIMAPNGTRVLATCIYRRLIYSSDILQGKGLAWWCVNLHMWATAFPPLVMENKHAFLSQTHGLKFQVESHNWWSPALRRLVCCGIGRLGMGRFLVSSVELLVTPQEKSSGSGSSSHLGLREQGSAGAAEEEMKPKHWNSWKPSSLCLTSALTSMPQVLKRLL